MEEVPMRARSVIPLLVGLTSLAAAQEAPVRVYPGERLVSLTAGVGNAMGWFGAQGERYFLDERLSIFLGVGYTPQIDPGDPTGPTFAAGLRSFTSGLKHRFFLEASASQLVLETEGADGGGRHYGPGLQGGWRRSVPGTPWEFPAGETRGPPRSDWAWGTPGDGRPGSPGRSTGGGCRRGQRGK
jgi:hypothetical protein